MKTRLSDRLSATNPAPDGIRVRANERLMNQSGTLHGSGGSPALWVEALSQITCTARSSGTERSMRFKKLRNSTARCWSVIWVSS